MHAPSRDFPAAALAYVKATSAWRLALLAGFAILLLLIVFVAVIGLQQLRVAANNLDSIVDLHMQKQNFTQTMVAAARERTIILILLAESDEAGEREILLKQFKGNAQEFINARTALLNMPLSERERALLRLQGQMTGVALPMQEQVLDLVSADFTDEAEELVLKQAIPAQNKVLEALSQLNIEARQQARQASLKASEAHHLARFWMLVLSGSALLVGLVVAGFVLHFTHRVSREREHLATHDALTGLPNRMLFMDRLEQSLVRAQRHQTLVAVMFIDLDRFKRVNDTLGHAQGDLLICEVAQRLRTHVSAENVVARLGGDEFVVVISDVDELIHILQRAESILAAATEPYRLLGREIFSSFSIGVSIYPHDGADSSTLLKHADTAMYQAKQQGRNRFQMYDPAMNAMAEERLQLETDLHHALDRKQLVYHYQPQLNLRSGRIQGLEALIRWNHPERGLLAPSAFLELLEETGEIVRVGRALLADACRQTARWHAAGFDDLGLAINLSGKEFWDESLVKGIDSALQQSGLPPQLLQLELTEGILMQDVDLALQRILALKALGVSVAVDDFGTGYSALAHLKRFPIDVLKIDRYFVSDIQDAAVNEALVSSILGLCQRLELDAVVEGVENRQQLESLRRLGSQIVQGHLISEPVAAERIIMLLHRNWLNEFGPIRLTANA